MKKVEMTSTDSILGKKKKEEEKEVAPARLELATFCV